MRGPSPWNADLDARLTSDWDAGFSTAEIGRRMGFSKNSVIGRAHRLQLPTRGSPINLSQAQAIPWTEEDDALLTRIYGGFLTAAQIGARMGRTTHAIAYRAAHLGLKAGRRAKQTGQRVSPSAQPSAGRGASSSPWHTRPATISRASSFRAVERLDSSPQVENLPEAVAEMPPPRVFSGTECKYPLHGDERPVSPRFCAEPVRDNAKGCASPYCAAHYAIAYAAPVKRPTHPPPALAERCVKAGSKPGDMVLDPFGGAGTTGLVADRLGRHATLIELNPEYARLARERITADAPLLMAAPCA